MLLSDIFESVRVNLYDVSNGLDYWTDARLLSKVNDAIHVVRQMLIATTPTYEFKTDVVTVTNAATLPYVLVPATSFASPVRTVVHAYRRAYSTTHDSPFCKIIEFEEIENEQRSALRELPPIFLYNKTVGFVQPPEAETEFAVAYIAQPVGATSGADNFTLPDDVSPLTVTLTTALCCAAENRDAQPWFALFTNMAQAMGVDYQRRNDTPETPQ